jgi:hypothetical protein
MTFFPFRESYSNFWSTNLKYIGLLETLCCKEYMAFSVDKLKHKKTELLLKNFRIIFAESTWKRYLW